MASQEAELGKLRERAHRLWEGQAAGKGFVHRVSQLSAQYLALSNLTKVTLLPTSNPATPFLSLTVSVLLPEKCCSMLNCAMLDVLFELKTRAFCPPMLFIVVLCYLLCHALFPSRTSVMVAVISLPWVKRLYPKKVSLSVVIYLSTVICLSPPKGCSLITIKKAKAVELTFYQLKHF